MSKFKVGNPWKTGKTKSERRGMWSTDQKALKGSDNGVLREATMISLEVNGKYFELDVSPDVPLLWVIREYLKLTGTKYGCGIGICGACTIHVDGKARRSCQIPIGDARGKGIITIEGLREDHPVKKAWIVEQVPQCGYCQPGQIMQAAALLSEDPNPSEERIIKGMDGNLCRCGTYPRIKRAIKRAVQEKEKR